MPSKIGKSAENQSFTLDSGLAFRFQIVILVRFKVNPSEMLNKKRFIYAFLLDPIANI